jgi:hypothetical protein
MARSIALAILLTGVLVFVSAAAAAKPPVTVGTFESHSEFALTGVCAFPVNTIVDVNGKFRFFDEQGHTDTNVVNIDAVWTLTGPTGAQLVGTQHYTRTFFGTPESHTNGQPIVLTERGLTFQFVLPGGRVVVDAGLLVLLAPDDTVFIEHGPHPLFPGGDFEAICAGLAP